MDGSVVLALGFWATLLTGGWGGRDPRVLTYGGVLVLLALLLLRPWRVLTPLVIALPTAIGVAAFAVLALAPTGWEGRHDAAAYAYAGQVFVLVAGWARDHLRRTAVLGLVVAAAGLEFAQGWPAWWGAGDPSAMFQGTFYWHNQVGIFLAAGAVAALGVLSGPKGPLRLLSWVVGPLAAAGVVFTTSRGSQLALALGVALVLALALTGPAPRRAAGRVVTAVALGAAVTWLLSGPPFFVIRATPGTSTLARSESFTGNGVQRLEDWRRAWEIFLEWPLTGTGFLGFRSAAPQVTELRDGASVAEAHNGFLQALSDGGLLLALPVWTGTVLVLVLALRHLTSSVRRRDTVTSTAAVLTFVLVLHSGMDFDWSYPSLMAMLAVAGALAIGVRPAPPLLPGRRASSAWALLLVAVLGGAAVGGWTHGNDRNAAVVMHR